MSEVDFAIQQVEAIMPPMLRRLTFNEFKALMDRACPHWSGDTFEAVAKHFGVVLQPPTGPGEGGG